MRFVWLALALLALLWGPLLNGYPFFLADTTTYARGADAAAYRLTGVETSWTAEFHRRFGPTSNASAAARPAEEPVVLSGRSIYYGALLYLSSVAGSLWLAVIGQALLTLGAIWLTMRRFIVGVGRQNDAPATLTILLLSLVTGLSFFVGYLMPDIFTALGILAVASLLVFEMFWKERLFWLALLAGALLFHVSNFPITVGMILLALLATALGAIRLRRGGLIAVAVALAAGAAGNLFFSLAVEQATGNPPVRPPFLMARLVADGPGAEFLRETCPGSGFFICRYAGNLPDHSDLFLWGDRTPGIFSAASPDERRRIAAEELRFVAEVVRSRPLAVLSSSARAILRQGTAVGLGEFNYDAPARWSYEQKVPPAFLQKLRQSRAFQERMPHPAPALLTVTLLVSLAAIAAALVRRRGKFPAMFVLLVLAGVVVDVIVCGALSTPHDRYLMRVAWLIPLSALGIWLPRVWRSPAARLRLT